LRREIAENDRKEEDPDEFFKGIEGNVVVVV